MRVFIAVVITKILIYVGKLMGKQGSSTPGQIAMKICPNILGILASQIKEKSVVVCGTNGKTTTNNLLYSLVASTNKKVVCNFVGANMIMGVVTAFVDKANIFGKLDADFAVIEVDEISTIKVFDYLKPDFMVITNLFRDQLDRYGEIDLTVKYLTDALKKSPETQLILNGDDPLVAAFGTKMPERKCQYFSVGEKVKDTQNEIKEGRFCPICGAELEYNYYHYSQLGKYQCICGFASPICKYTATNVNLENGISFQIEDREISVNYRGFYNIYNILASFAAARELGFSLEDINKILGNYKPQVGRMEEFIINNKRVILNLSKNPAGFNQGIATVLEDDEAKSIVIVINDNAQDGKDISWIWDVNFERLKDCNSDKIIVSGIRHLDMSLRLKYEDISNFTYDNSIENAIKNALNTPVNNIYILVNYTALFSTQNLLKGWAS